ncbi:MAG TPA: hypothetical protein VF984_14350 [Actinomycetota bacterium]
MKTRWIAVGAVIGLGVALTLGFAFGSGPRVPAGQAMNATFSSGDSSDWWAAMDAMHDSAWMEQMREHMGPEFAAQCDRLHEQMQQQLGNQDRDQIRQHMTDQMREHMSQVGGFGPGPGMMGGYGPGSMMDGYGPGGMMGS